MHLKGFDACFKDGTQEHMSLGNPVLGPTFAAFSNTSIAYKYTCRDAKSEKGCRNCAAAWDSSLWPWWPSIVPQVQVDLAPKPQNQTTPGVAVTADHSC